MSSNGIGCWLLAAALTVGCGNYSNDDLEFALALPTADSLVSKFPNQVRQDGLTGGLGQKQAGLALGETSKLYSDSLSGAATFNLWVYAVAVTIDYVRQQPVTTRTA